ncbi:response regulator transcription factor [Proteocatella sphenisci]|uniref:response regulator transcription factor n=1 Tax=Proteocatella sphenisci TaxID=181070 RepID=UPI00048F12B4|nr:response regulator transcription factor [Proteocatella sphenisci]
MVESKKILIVEDEEKIAEAIEAYLKNSGYETFKALNGRDAIDMFEKKSPDLVILDLMLPEISGEEICRHIRRSSRTPVIMLTAKVTENDRVQGLDIGADDYISKPFSPRELVARVAAILRRTSENTHLFNKMSWNDSDLEIDISSSTVRKNGVAVNLTPSEYSILLALIKHPNMTFTREELISITLGEDYEGYDRIVDSHIKNLRSKIETDTSSPQYILTVRGIGYKFGV